MLKNWYLNMILDEIVDQTFGQFNLLFSFSSIKMTSNNCYCYNIF